MVEKSYYNQTDFDNLVEKIAQAIKNKKLIIFIGAGVSFSQGYPNWNGYVKSLIQYWKNHIENDLERKLKFSELRIFDSIEKSKRGNKRKIKMLHAVLEKMLGTEWINKKLDFEKYYFDALRADSDAIEILGELVKLSCIFITTNYDFEIERHLDYIGKKGTYRTIHSLEGFVATGEKLQVGDVFHLHGTNEAKPEYFISSSSDYSNQYLRNPGLYNKLQKWFLEENPTVLFVGSNMEEDEILSLLPSTSENFSLMKVEEGENEDLREILNLSYHDVGTTIFWYGDDYNELPKVIHSLVKEVEKILPQPEVLKDWKILLTQTTPDEELFQSLNKNIEYHDFMSNLYLEIENSSESHKSKILKAIFDDKSFEIATDNGSFWNFVDQNWKLLKVDNKNQLVTILETRTIITYLASTYNIYKRLKDEAMLVNEHLDRVEEKLIGKPELVVTKFNKDQDLMGKWLVGQSEDINNVDRNLFVDKFDFCINIKSENISRLVSNIESGIGYRYSSIEDAVSERHGSSEFARLIYNLLLNDKLLIDGLSIFESIPDVLLDTALFKRLLVLVDKTKPLQENLLDRLIQKIDFENKFSGSELTNFVQKHESKILELGKNISDDKQYEDVIGRVHGGIVSEDSFITLEEISEKTEKEILDILRQSKTEQDSSPWKRKTVRQTGKILQGILTKQTDLSDKLKKILGNADSNVVMKYKELFVQLSTDESFDLEVSKSAQEKLIDNFDVSHFTYEDEQFFEYFIEHEEFTTKIIDLLFSISVNNLSYDQIYSSEESNRLVEVNDFINTEQGRYLDTIIKLGRKTEEFNGKIKSKLEEVQHLEFRDFSQGALFKIYTLKELEVFTVNHFQGYSYSYRDYNEDNLGRLSPSVEEILREGYVNQLNQFNVSLLALKEMNPSELESISWENNFSMMIDIVLKNVNKFRYEENWFKEILVHDTNGRYLSQVMHRFADLETDVIKLENSILLLKEIGSAYPTKVRLNYIPTNLKETQYKERLYLYFDIILVLLDNSKIQRSYMGSRQYDELLEHLSPKKRSDFLENSNLGEILSPIEIGNLQRKYL